MDEGTKSASVLESIREHLRAHGVSFREVHHEPTPTSEDSARARGESMSIGGKALLMKADEQFALFVLPADRKVESSAIRRELNCRKLRFASRDELLEQTGLVPGSVPPFGKPILPFPLYLDAALAANEKIAFNAGSLTDSIIFTVADYLAITTPERVFPFSTGERKG